MEVKLLRQEIGDVCAQWVILGIFEDDRESPESLRGSPLDDRIRQLAASRDLTGTLGELTPLFGVGGLAADCILVVGLGARSRFDSGAAYTAGLAAAKRLAAKERESVAIMLPPVEDALAVATALVEGAIVGTRGPGIRKSELNRHPFGSLGFVVGSDRIESDLDGLAGALRRAEIVGEAVNLARDLVNTPPADKTPAKLSDRVGVLAADAGIILQIWDESRIRQERFGGLLGVAAGSDEPPRFLILDHRGGGDSPCLALVGKGVTFDSGGLCLKPSASMEAMKSDMTGAAVVVAAMQAIARLSLPVNVRGYVALTENMTGGKAMKLGDVFCMRNGKTVEIMNTDAEGRLILADALSFAAEQRPHRMLDLATLTGACMVALGPKVAGLFSNDDAFCEDLLAACRKTGERVWRMPLDHDYKEQLKSSVADLKNIGGKWGGAITAAKFLEQFVDSTPWIHLDIAGPSWCDSENTTRDAGATGCFVRTLVSLIEHTQGAGPKVAG
jgi:leucyl aminopeptidase